MAECSSASEDTMTTQPRTVYRFEFVHRVDIDEVEQTLALSILAVGCLQGLAAIRLDAGYAIDRDSRVIVVDGDTETGRAVTRVFTGFCIHEFGDDAFSVSRPVEKGPRGGAAAQVPASAGA
jgi:hypothetical protein